MPLKTNNASGDQYPAADQNVVAKAVNMLTGIATVASAATPSIDCAITRQLNVTALATNITGVTVSNAVDGQRLTIRIKDNGTSRAVALGSSFRAMGVTIPAATNPNKTLYLECAYNAADNVFDVIAAYVQTFVAYDSMGAGYSGNNGGSASWQHITTVQGYMLAYLVVDRAVSTPTATLGGKAMTLLANLNLNGTNGSNGVLLVFGVDMKAAGITAGANTVVVTTNNVSWNVGNSECFTGVANVAAPLTTRGANTNPAQSVTWSDGVIAQCFGAVGGATAMTPSGGTNRYSQITSSSNAAISISDASATTAFSATPSAPNWAAFAIALT